MAMEFSFKKWKQCLVSGLPMDSPLFCFGTIKTIPFCVCNTPKYTIAGFGHCLGFNKN